MNRHFQIWAAAALVAMAGMVIGGATAQSADDFRSSKSRDRFGRPEQRFFNDLRRRTVDISAHLVGELDEKYALDTIVVFAVGGVADTRQRIVGHLAVGGDTRINLSGKFRALEFQTYNMRRRLVLPGGRFIIVRVDVTAAPDGKAPDAPDDPPRAVITELVAKVEKSN